VEWDRIKLSLNAIFSTSRNFYFDYRNYDNCFMKTNIKTQLSQPLPESKTLHHLSSQTMKGGFLVTNIQPVVCQN
jgi:hypothetical protein